MTPKPPYPLVAITWNDAHSVAAADTYDATDLKDAHGTMPVVTVGWLLRDDERGLTVANEWFPGGTEFRGLTFIPKAMEASRVVLRGVRVRLARPASPLPST